MAQKDKWSPELLLFRQIDRVNKTISGDLNEATFESMEDYMHKVRNSVLALEALLHDELQDDEEYQKPERDTSRYTEPELAKVFQHLMERYREAMGVVKRQHILGQEMMIEEDPV